MLLTRGGNSFLSNQFHSNKASEHFPQKHHQLQQTRTKQKRKIIFHDKKQRTKKVSDSETFWKFIVFSGSHFTLVQFFSIQIIKHFSIENPLTCISKIIWKKRNVCIFYAFSHINNLCLTNNIFNYSILLRKNRKLFYGNFFIEGFLGFSFDEWIVEHWFRICGALRDS